MKKVIFLVAFVAASAFGANFSNMSDLAVVDSVKSGDVKSFAEAGFELSKRVSLENKDCEDACLVFGNMIKKELANKTPEQKRAFRNEFDMYFYANFETLSKLERDTIDRKACYRYAKGPKGCKGCKNSDMSVDCPLDRKNSNMKSRPCMQKGVNPPCGMNPKMGQGRGMGQGMNSQLNNKALGRNAGLNPSCPFNKNADLDSDDTNSSSQNSRLGENKGAGARMSQGQGMGMGQGMRRNADSNFSGPKCQPNLPCPKGNN